MPSPVLHCAVGAAIYGLRRGSLGRKRGRLAGLIIVAALLPDIDFLPGLIVGDPNLANGIRDSMAKVLLRQRGVSLRARNPRNSLGLQVRSS